MAPPAKKTGSFITKKGPLGLPVYAWLLILAGGVAGGLYLRSRLAGSQTTNGATTSSPVDSSGVDSSGAGTGAAAGNTGTGATAGASSGLGPDLSQALTDALNANSGTVVSLASTVAQQSQSVTDLASTEVNAGIAAQQNALTFAQGAFGTATDFANTALSSVTTAISDLHQSVSPTQPPPVNVTVNVPSQEPAAPAPTPHATVSAAASKPPVSSSRSSSGAAAVKSGAAKTNPQAKYRAY